MGSYTICCFVTGLFHLVCVFKDCSCCSMDQNFLPFYGYYSIGCIYHILLIHSSISGNLGYFQGLTLMHNAAVNVNEHTCWSPCCQLVSQRVLPVHSPLVWETLVLPPLPVQSWSFKKLFVPMICATLCLFSYQWCWMLLFIHHPFGFFAVKYCFPQNVPSTILWTGPIRQTLIFSLAFETNHSMRKRRGFLGGR